jgi:DNA repair exonuclease SbcCD nuclease subunit
MIERRNNKKPNLLLMSDPHLREDTPICYTGDYQKEQWGSMDFISDLQKHYGCPVICGGDLFDKWKPSPWLLRQTILHLPDQFYTVYGQHDLPQHSLALTEKCGIDVLQAAGKLKVLPGAHWGQHPADGSFITETGKVILVWHKMNFKGKPPWPGCTDPSASTLLSKYPQFDLILTGDNHKTFAEEFEGRVLVNPGSMMRMDADQIDHKPCIFLWYAEDNSIKQIFLPIEEGVISQDHIIHKEERDARIDAFVSRLDDSWEAKMSFEDNLEEFFKTNTIRDSVKEIVYKSLES